MEMDDEKENVRPRSPGGRVGSDATTKLLTMADRFEQLMARTASLADGQQSLLATVTEQYANAETRLAALEYGQLIAVEDRLKASIDAQILEVRKMLACPTLSESGTNLRSANFPSRTKPSLSTCRATTAQPPVLPKRLVLAGFGGYIDKDLIQTAAHQKCEGITPKQLRVPQPANRAIITFDGHEQAKASLEKYRSLFDDGLLRMEHECEGATRKLYLAREMSWQQQMWSRTTQRVRAAVAAALASKGVSGISLATQSGFLLGKTTAIKHNMLMVLAFGDGIPCILQKTEGFTKMGLIQSDYEEGVRLAIAGG